MAITKSDLAIGVILVNEGSNTARKILDYAWVEVNGVSVKYWIAALGSVGTGKFVQAEDADYVSAYTVERLLRNYENVWIPGKGYKDGDILVSQAGNTHFIVKGEGGGQKLWRLSAGRTFWTTLQAARVDYGPLKQVIKGYTDEDVNFKTLH